MPWALRSSGQRGNQFQARILSTSVPDGSGTAMGVGGQIRPALDPAKEYPDTAGEDRRNAYALLHKTFEIRGAR